MDETSVFSPEHGENTRFQALLKPQNLPSGKVIFTKKALKL